MLPKFLTELDPNIYKSSNYLVLDFETTNIEKGNALNPENRLLLGVYNDTIHWGGEYEQKDLHRRLDECDFLVAHNAKFELQWIQRTGYDIGNLVVFDTQIAEYVLAGNQRNIRVGLDACLGRRGMPQKANLVSMLIKAGVCPSVIPRSYLEKYCVQDVRVTETLFKSQLKELDETNRLAVLFTRCLLTPVLADIEDNGMFLREEYVNELYDVGHERLQKAQAKMDEFTGGINFNSPKQLGEYLYDTLGFEELKTRGGKPKRTAKGGRLTGKDALDALKSKTPEQRKFKKLLKEAKEAGSDMGDYLSKFKACCDEAGGILKGQFNQTVTKTHRLSSSGREYKIQFQNFKREYKKVFGPRQEGWEIAEADGAQLEFRVAGHIGNDDVIRRMVANNEDAHKVTASLMNQCTIEEVTKDMRQDAKAWTFRPLYGGNGTDKKSQRYIDGFVETYWALAQTQNQWVYEALDKKMLISEWGLRTYWPHIRMNNQGYINERTKICNYWVQSFATAEIIPIALVYLWHRIRDVGAKMVIVNTVHDSAIVEHPVEERELFNKLAVQCFTHDVYDYLKKVYNIDFSVDLGCGVQSGQFWGDGEETTTNVRPDTREEWVA